MAVLEVDAVEAMDDDVLAGPQHDEIKHDE